MNTIKAPQQKRAVKTREKLLNSALELFLSNGFYNITSKDISKHAGVSIGVFYNYFRDKNKIYCEVLEQSYLISNSATKTLLNNMSESTITNREYLYKYSYDAIKNVEGNLTFFLERDKIRSDYKEINDLLVNLDMNYILSLSKFLKCEDNLIKAKLLFETTNRNVLVSLSITDEEERKKYIIALVDMICEYYLSLL